MEAVGIILIALVVVTLLVAGLVLAHRAEMAKRAALQAVADARGWRYDHARDRSLASRLAHFSPFARGQNRYAQHTLSGTLDISGRPFRIWTGEFHYQVTRSNGKSTSTSHYFFSYAVLELPFEAVPEMSLRTEHLFDKLTQAMGFEDIDFESAEFSRRFRVKGADKRFVYDVVNPEMMSFLLSAFPCPIEIERGRFLLSDGTTRWKPDQYPGMVDWAIRFFELWPRHVLHALDDARAGSPHT